MPAERFAEQNEQAAPFTAAEVAADLERALSVADLPKSEVDKQRVVRGVEDNFDRCQEQLTTHPQYPEEAKRHLVTAALATSFSPRLVLANAEQWVRRAALPDEFRDSEKQDRSGLTAQRIVQEAVKNFALLSASRRLNDMRQFGKMTISLLNEDTLDGESQAVLLEVARQLLYAKPIDASGAGSDLGQQTKAALNLSQQNQAALRDFRNDLLRRLLFDVRPDFLVTPASKEMVSVEIGLDNIEINEGIPPRLLKAETQLLATIAHMPHQEFDSFLRQQLMVYNLPKAGEQENKRLTELLRIITRLKTLQSTILGRGESGSSAIMQHNSELNGLPQAAADALGQKIDGLSKLVATYRQRPGPIVGDQAA